MVKKLRDAGCIILAKVNLHEWAGGGGSVTEPRPEILKAAACPMGYSSLGQQTHNPHVSLARPRRFEQRHRRRHLRRSSRNSARHRTPAAPSAIRLSANGIVGLKPNTWLAERDGYRCSRLAIDFPALVSWPPTRRMPSRHAKVAYGRE